MSENATQFDADKLRELLANATPGPWRLVEHADYFEVAGESYGHVRPDGSTYTLSNGVCSDESYYPRAVSYEDMELIVAMHAALSAMLGDSPNDSST